MKKVFSALLLILLLSTFADATTWYVGPSGSGGSDSNTCMQAQTISTPKLNFKGVNGALACIGAAGTDTGAGDTLIALAGTYTESLVNVIPSGTVGNEFTMKCATHLACTLSESSSNPNIGFGTASHYIIIRDFIITGGNGSYMSGASAGVHHHIQWLYNEFVALNIFSIEGSGSSDISMIGNVIHDIGDLCPAEFTPGAFDAGRCHGIYASDYTDDWIITDNEIYDVSGYGIQLYASSVLPTGFLIERNKIHNAGNGDPLPPANGAGMIVYGSGHTIRNNLSYSNNMEGILMRAVSTTVVYNNTVWDNGASGISMESGSSTTCRNNLAIANAGTAIVGCTTISDNWTTGTQGSHFVDAGSGNLALIVSSDAVDVCADLSATFTTDFVSTSRPQGADWDCGAYEFTGGGGGAGGPIVVDTTSAGTTNANPATAGVETRSFTNAATDLSLLIDFVHHNSDFSDQVASVTFNGDALTRDSGIASSSFGSVEAWYRKLPDVATGNVIASFVGSQAGGQSIISMEGVDQASPFGDEDTATGTSALSTTLTLSTTAGDLAISCMTIRESMTGSSAIGTITPASGTAFSEVDMSNTDMKGRCLYKFAVDSSTSVGWSWTASTSWAHLAIIVRPDTTTGGGGGGISVISNYLRKNQN